VHIILEKLFSSKDDQGHKNITFNLANKIITTCRLDKSFQGRFLKTLDRDIPFMPELADANSNINFLPISSCFYCEGVNTNHLFCIFRMQAVFATDKYGKSDDSIKQIGPFALLCSLAILLFAGLCVVMPAPKQQLQVPSAFLPFFGLVFAFVANSVTSVSYKTIQALNCLVIPLIFIRLVIANFGSLLTDPNHQAVNLVLTITMLLVLSVSAMYSMFLNYDLFDVIGYRSLFHSLVLLAVLCEFCFTAAMLRYMQSLPATSPSFAAVLIFSALPALIWLGNVVVYHNSDHGKPSHVPPMYDNWKALCCSIATFLLILLLIFVWNHSVYKIL
jgi:hypothetical protein